MHRLSLIVVVLLVGVQVHSQSPHGELLKISCSDCHISEGWRNITDSIVFNHQTTGYLLDGGHKSVDCKSCHTSLVFNEVSNQCASCHTDIHNMSLGDNCAACHTPKDWLVDNIPELHEQNGFALVGSHALASCIDCHVSVNSLVFDRIGNECNNCHMQDYSVTQNPNHTAVGFSTNCIECHDPFATGWSSEIINHSFFPLEQGHDIDDCLKCHLPNDYSSASPECSSCHIDDFTATSNPNHNELGFSTGCAECHTIAGWSPASYDHSIFPLNGAHATTSCNECHNGNYTSTPNTCFACHEDDYNAASNPNHKQLSFSTNCVECHNELAWKPSSFDHDGQYFPIYSGEHAGEWNLCSDCHTNSSDYSVFSCIICHNDQADLADEHSGISNYSYNSAACFNCHPDGSEGD